MNTQRGVVVKIDGVDGCGKTTLVRNLCASYERNLRVACTREFGSDDDDAVAIGVGKITVAEFLYEFALAPRFGFDQIERQLAMALVARRQNRVALPRLRSQNDLIISDRSSLSSYAYGHDLGHGFEQFLDWVIGSVLEEEHVLWIDLDPTVAFGRSQADRRFVFEKAGKDLVEMRGLEYQIAVQAKFAHLCHVRRNIIRLDGRLHEADLLAAAKAHVDTILADWSRLPRPSPQA